MQVLVHVSTYQAPFWYRIFEPHPYGCYGSKKKMGGPTWNPNGNRG